MLKERVVGRMSEKSITKRLLLQGCDGSSRNAQQTRERRVEKLAKPGRWWWLWNKRHKELGGCLCAALNTPSVARFRHHQGSSIKVPILWFAKNLSQSAGRLLRAAQAHTKQHVCAHAARAGRRRHQSPCPQTQPLRAKDSQSQNSGKCSVFPGRLVAVATRS